MPDRSPLPPHVTMPLLDVITRNSLDDDYRHVAESRSRAGASRPPSERSPAWRAAVVVGIFGLLIVTAFVQNSRGADAQRATREGLIRQIQLRSAELREQQGEISDLRSEIDRMQGQLASLIRSERSQATATTRLGAVAGYEPVGGEGVRILVDDSPSGHESGVVWDEDLALLVDGLWAAGAEAISVNGHRLTVLTGIRTAGSAINIGNVPIRPPYTILAIGDTSRLQADFAESSSGSAWWNFVRNHGFEFDMTNAESLSLPAARRPDLSLARQAASTQTLEVTP